MTRQSLHYHKCCSEPFASLIKMQQSPQVMRAAAAFIILIFTNDYNDHIMLLLLSTLGNDPGFCFLRTHVSPFIFKCRIHKIFSVFQLRGGSTVHQLFRSNKYTISQTQSSVLSIAIYHNVMSYERLRFKLRKID